MTNVSLCAHVMLLRAGVREPRAPPSARRPVRSAFPWRVSAHGAPALRRQESSSASVPARAAVHDRPASGADRDPPVSHPFDMADHAIPHSSPSAATSSLPASSAATAVSWFPRGSPFTHCGRPARRAARSPRPPRGAPQRSARHHPHIPAPHAAQHSRHGDSSPPQDLEQRRPAPPHGRSREQTRSAAHLWTRASASPAQAAAPSRARSPPTPERSSPAPRAPSREPARGCWASWAPSAGSPACSSGR